nr:trafficking protein particle complex subunit 13 [Quercus suber]
MAHHARSTSNAASGPHAISLKVLRLSRPTLATQTALPSTAFGNGLDIAASASLAYPSTVSANTDEQSTFPLTPLLMLPAAFGAAYVGETFACTLCANNEVRHGEGRTVSGVRVVAELQTPSAPGGTALTLEGSAGDDAAADETLVGATMQRTLRHELKEEGPHVLAVTVSYTETTVDEATGARLGGRARTFRKLYQFVAQQLIAVRSKVTERKRKNNGTGRQWILEAQLENVGEGSVVLERVWLKERDGIESQDLNKRGVDEGVDATVLKPQDVEQVMFLLNEKRTPEEVQGRIPLAQLTVDWTSAMGERGSLTTGWLASRIR